MLFEEVKEIISEQISVDKDSIELTSRLDDELNMDRLDMIDLAMTIEDQYAIEVPDEALDEMKTVEDIVIFIESHTDEE